MTTPLSSPTLVARLRARRRPIMAAAGIYTYQVNDEPDPLCQEAANEIERLSSPPAHDDVERVAREATEKRFETRLATEDQRNGYEVGYAEGYRAALSSTQDTASQDVSRRPIMLEIAAANAAHHVWERRWRALTSMYAIDRCFVDQDGKWGLRDFLDYAGQACGFNLGFAPGEPESLSSTDTGDIRAATIEECAKVAENCRFPQGWVGNDGQVIIASQIRALNQPGAEQLNMTHPTSASTPKGSQDD